MGFTDFIRSLLIYRFLKQLFFGSDSSLGNMLDSAGSKPAATCGRRNNHDNYYGGDCEYVDHSHHGDSGSDYYDEFDDCYDYDDSGALHYDNYPDDDCHFDHGDDFDDDDW